ncbi:energy transducer TonB [Eikenella sp. S3360]|uniref:Energy transducer TonB n=1 Tax=Eikenella glucosivorans TaxID=2766967 RepID=A0ABS0NCD7_9NEIS|nr:energy transducer TonB [Eikenella glucosivorans]MBH5329944.1 energy transducer TonB [Eikenella glucosivorans]
MIRKILFPALAALLLAACAAKPSYEPAMLIHSVKPAYPPQYEEEGITGSTTVQMRIDTQGKVRAVRVLSATHPLFARSAERAAWQYRFTPAKQNGQPVESIITQAFRFKMAAETPGHSKPAQPPSPPLPKR